MTLALTLFGIAGLTELFIYLRPFWHVRRVLAAAMLVFVASVSGLLFADHACLASSLLVIISLYRVFNLLRLVEGRMQEQYLHRVTLRSSLVLLVFQVLILILWAGSYLISVPAPAGWSLLALGQLLVAIVVYRTTRHYLRASVPPVVGQFLSNHDLPSITVCIPARNETEALEECLQSLVASTYPKLEVLVLDDCSQDRTPEIIKSFAHDGIRFIKGDEPPKHWLAKNWAYARLAEEANGELLVFGGVDIRFSPDSLRMLVTSMKAEHTKMACLIPRNEMMIGRHAGQSTLLQPMRYAWEFCLPRTFLRRQPVLSSCWAIDHSLLKHVGGFEAVLSAITPESHFANAAAQSGSYHFIAADGDFAVTSNKSLSEQWQTAVRTRYPQLHRRPEAVFAFSVAELACLVAPFVMALVAAILHDWLIAAVCSVSYLLQAISYSRVVRLTYRRFLLRSMITLLGAAILDVAIRHYSMWRYEFSEVLWKGRNVCLPVMHVVPHLPNEP